MKKKVPELSLVDEPDSEPEHYNSIGHLEDGLVFIGN